MDKKRLMQVFLFMCIAITVVIVIVVLLRGKDNNSDNGKIEDKPLNNINLSQVFEEIEKIEGMEKIENMEQQNAEVAEGEEEVEKIPDEEIIDFGKYNILEKKAIVNTTDEEVNEVWMIKLGSYEDQEEVCRILGTRLQKLRNAFEENNVQKDILDRAVIKQEDGVVIMIVSPEVERIEAKIAEQMN